MTEHEPPSEEIPPYLDNRGVLLDRVLKRHLRHRFAVELGGPYDEYQWTGVNNEWNRRIDATYLQGEATIVRSLIADLVEAGPDGAILATRVVFDAAVEQAKRRETFRRPGRGRGGEERGTPVGDQR
jgi:hypothetical protein